MPTLMDYKGIETTWCPGCGNFAILTGIKQALVGLDLEPHEVTIFSGIGQAAKLPLYMKCNMLNGLHGRALPLATGARLVNHEQRMIVVGGDGDGFAEGGNHFLHAVRRNLDLAYFVHNNQVYGLTKGQASPTSDKGFVTGTTPGGVTYGRFNPAGIAITLGAAFVGRTHTGAMEHMVKMMRLAIETPGFALLEILQPCVTYNKVNTLKWYREKSYDIEQDKGYDPSNREQAFRRSLEWDEGFPIGVLYRGGPPSMTGRHIPPEEQPLALRPSAARDVTPLLEAYR